MAKIRSIKPEFFQHDELFELEKETGLPIRLAFAGLWTQCDREGRFEWKPRFLKLQILPYDDVDFAAVLDALESRGFVARYEADSRQFGCVPSFSRHQMVNNRESGSKIPAPPVVDACPTRAPRVEVASTTRGQRDDHAAQSCSSGTGTGTGTGINPPLPPTGGDDHVIQTIVESWNAIPDVPKVLKLTDKRLRALKARLKDSGFRENWPAGLRAISRSDFCRGLKPGASWRADFDWFLKPDTLVVLLEGKYENPNGQPGTRSAAKPETTDTAAGPLLRITTEEATDREKFNDWVDRQQSFELNDGTRRYLHSVRCNTARLFRKPEVARDQLYARLHDRAAGCEIESPSYEDRQQAERDLEDILQTAGGAA